MSGIRLDQVAGALTYPTSLAFGEDGTAYVAEAGLPFGGATAGGRVLRLGPDGSRSVLAEGLNPPVNGLTRYRGGLLVSEGGTPARIRWLAPDGSWTPVLDGLPGPGNYHTNMTAVGPDGRVYFSQGAMTNSGIVGLDALDLGWLRRLPHSHDLPGLEIVLTGTNARTPNPLPGGDTTAVTGAFAPFGVPTVAGQHIPAALPCTAAIMRCDPNGRHLELVAWGLRNAYGLGFLPDGRLLAIDQGPDDRGSRPIGNGPDLLYEVRPGRWYGWPDFVGAEPVTSAKYRPVRGDQPTFLLANHDALPPPEQPLVRFPPHAAATRFAVAPPGSPWDGHLIVALFGDELPMTGPSGPRVGRALALVDLDTWDLRLLSAEGIARPIDVQVNPSDAAVYILDFGQFEMKPEGQVVARPETGALHRLLASAKG